MLLRLPSLILACGLLLAMESKDRENASATPKQEDPFWVAGYSIRTNNADEISGRGRIGNLWRRFIQHNLAASLPNRVDQSLVVVYSDYGSDERGEYGYLLGARVSSIEHLRPQMSYRKIVAGPYAVFTTSVGPRVLALQAAWQSIWSSSPAELGGQRAFLTDYELYDRRSADPDHAQIEIHIGLRARP
jgi:predicted transcriptional regulator YdeE